jgi:hypothetical protein
MALSSSFTATPREGDVGLDRAWVDAANDVASALLAELIRIAVRDRLPTAPFEDPANIQLVNRTVRSWIHSAHLGWIAATHSVEHTACLCRHEAIVIVGASVDSKATGVNYIDLADERMRLVKMHLRSKN